MTRRPRAATVPHPARDDGAGCCTTCRKPLTTWRNGKQVPAPNPLHVADLSDIPPAPAGPQDRAAGDMED